MTKAEQQTLKVTKIRMKDWSDDYIKQVYYNPRSAVWFQAARETLIERKVPKGKPPPPKPHYTRTAISGKDTHLNTFTTESLKVIAEKSGNPVMAEEARKILKTRTMNTLRKIVRWKFIKCFLSSFRWYRKLHGGKWFHVHVDHPVCSCVWCDVPDDAEPGAYREGLWRGTPTVEVWP